DPRRDPVKHARSDQQLLFCKPRTKTCSLRFGHTRCSNLSGASRRGKSGQVCYALKSVYSSLPAEVTDMSSGQPDAIAGATVAAVVADSGVSITAEEADAVARSLVRIEAAAAILLCLP